MKRILVATCEEVPDLKADDRAILPLLKRHGIHAVPAVWSDASVDWASADAVLIRSCWDYHLRHAEFLSWIGRLERAQVRVWNSPRLLRWNSDKRYLGDVAAAGIPVVPSEWSDPGEPVNLPTGEFVVKPSVGAGSRGVGRFGPDAHAAARSHAAALHDAGRVVMVQPYLADVDTSGETALIYFDGAFSHAVRKAPMLPEATVHDVGPDGTAGIVVPERITTHRADPDELRLGARVMALLRGRFGADLLYARVDVIPTPYGPVVLELELIEPSLHFRYDQDAAARFAASVSRRL